MESSNCQARALEEHARYRVYFQDDRAGTTKFQLDTDKPPGPPGILSGSGFEALPAALQAISQDSPVEAGLRGSLTNTPQMMVPFWP